MASPPWPENSLQAQETTAPTLGRAVGRAVKAGDWFNKTIRFDIAINTHDNMLVVRKGYGYDYIAYKRNKFKKVVEYIDYEIYKFIMDNINDSTKKINNKIIC